MFGGPNPYQAYGPYGSSPLGPYGPASPYGSSPLGPYGPASPYGSSPLGPYGPASPYGSFGPSNPYGPPIVPFAAPPVGIAHWIMHNRTWLPVEVAHLGGPPFTLWPRQSQPVVLGGDDRMWLRIYSLGNLINIQVSSGHVRCGGAESSTGPRGERICYFPMASIRVTVTPCHQVIIEPDRGSKGSGPL